MSYTKAYAALEEKGELQPFEFERRSLGSKDVQIDIDYCGVCHSDIHMVSNDWNMSFYPLVPGHEIVGRVKNVGADIIDLKVGDLVGVGCMVDSCQKCPQCNNDLEQFCEKGFTMTYGSEDHISGGYTFGGYSTQIVVDRHFVVKVPENLDIKAVAPLLCAGITTYSPLKRYNVKKGNKVGIIGLGGLGHMAIKFAAAMDAKVVMITSSQEKSNDAKRLGADEVVISTDKESMSSHVNSFDLLIDTIPSAHEINQYLPLLKNEKTLVAIGATPVELNSMGLIFGQKCVTGSLIGGIKETQEMLDFCAEKNITADVELISIREINKAYTRMLKSDVKYRFVIDIKSLKLED